MKTELIEFSKYLCMNHNVNDGKSHIDYVNDYMKLHSERLDEQKPLTLSEHEEKVNNNCQVKTTCPICGRDSYGNICPCSG